MSFWAQIKIISIASVVLACSSVASAKDFFVFEERRPIAMKNGEHPPKDIFINAGANDGLKVGMVVPLERRQTVYDMYKSNTLSDLVVKIGEIRLIHVQPDISVGRVVSVANYDDGPALDFEAIMIGDMADVSAAHMGKKVAVINGPSGSATSASVMANATDAITSKVDAKTVSLKPAPAIATSVASTATMLEHKSTPQVSSIAPRSITPSPGQQAAPTAATP